MPIEQDSSLTKPAEADPVEAKNIVSDPIASSLCPHPDASQTMQNHIRLLREYNDIRDIGTSLMGIIADNRRMQMKRVYEEFDVDQKD
ncbi:MAG: hypothetical protein LQ343_000293 [Gyalolechia ehrenbergii]|nr:MAG: hypothetical protein LQ343_000293 [Gyalolechia ehrenbergii]